MRALKRCTALRCDHVWFLFPPQVLKRSSMNDGTITNDYQLMEDGSRFVGAANRGFQADNKRRKGEGCILPTTNLAIPAGC